MPPRVHDVVIVGGGPVGCAAAAALADTGLSVAVLEAQTAGNRAPDSRTLALSWNSKLILERLKAWPDTARPTPILAIHVSHRGRFGRARLSAADLQLPALGYVLRYSDAYDALLARTLSLGVEYRDGFKVNDIRPGQPVSEVSGTTAQGSETVRARLVVIADGGAALTHLATRSVREHDYEQAAVVGLARPDRAHGNLAYERFTPAGPIALLPCEDEFAFVWTCTPAQAASLSKLDDENFLAGLRDAFGDRAGRFISTRLRSSFPLVMRVAGEQAEAGVVLLGNASQTLHPIAGQGFNLGLRDAWDLADLVRSIPADELGSHSMTSRFRAQRRMDRTSGIVATHGLAKLFSNDLIPLAAGRGVGLSLLDTLAPLKRALMRRMIFGPGR
jgi:2-octaprenyl-6-methoxyphenol hydroxylase